MGKFNYFLNVPNYLGCNTSSLALIFSTNTFASHNVFEVWFSVAQEVHKHFGLHGWEGNLHGRPGEIAGMVPHRRPLHLLLGLVHPLGQLLLGVVPRLAPDGYVQLGSDNEDRGDQIEDSHNPAASSFHR